MDWMAQGKTAVITGGAGGIGLEAARRYAMAGMNVVISDVKEEPLQQAAEELRQLGAEVLAKVTDVREVASMEALRDATLDRFGKVHCLMNNAGIASAGTKPWENLEAAENILAVNMMGVIHGCHVFIPSMLAHGEQGVVINTGSKQGITRPPGSYAYNLSKSGVLAYTESLAHAFRNEDECRLSSHLLVPGFVYTPMIAQFIPEKPAFAATAEETVDFLMKSLMRGDFYIICPDPETPRELDERRIQWNTDDIIKNRPALSRWHPEFEKTFKAYIEEM